MDPAPLLDAGLHGPVERRVRLPVGLTDKEFALGLLEAEKVLTVFGSGFSEELGSGYLRLVYLLPDELLQESVRRIGRYLDQVSN